MLATNALKIVNLRRNGYRPDEMVIVSLVGKVQELNHVVYAFADKEYEWDWCKGLDICIFASSAVDCGKTVKAIGIHKPRFLAVWDVDRLEGADITFFPSVASINKPQSQWKYVPYVITWCSLANKIFNGEICN